VLCCTVLYCTVLWQSLFEFSDCEQRAFKSEAAARRLQSIFPGMRARGLVATIPMPGAAQHSTADEMR
jgi:hypothetical protein